MIAIFTKDIRMSLLADQLEKKTEVLRINKQMDSLLLSRQPHHLKAVILPMSGLDSQGQIRMNGWNYPFWTWYTQNPFELTVFSGTAGTLKHPQLTMININENEQVKRGHARLSAQAILAVLITQTPLDFHDYHYDVLGDGACGQAMQHLLKQNECQVCGVSRHPGKDWIDYQTWKQRQPAEIIINTAAACVIDEKTTAHWTTKPWILDLATQAMGVSDQVKARYQVDAFPGLPAKSGPLSSAKWLSWAIEKELNL